MNLSYQVLVLNFFLTLIYSLHVRWVADDNCPQGSGHVSGIILQYMFGNPMEPSYSFVQLSLNGVLTTANESEWHLAH